MYIIFKLLLQYFAHKRLYRFVMYFRLIGKKTLKTNGKSLNFT